jgi:hypothetical protein
MEKRMRATRTPLQMFLTITAMALIGLTFVQSRAFGNALPLTDSGILTISNVAGGSLGFTAVPFASTSPAAPRARGPNIKSRFRGFPICFP